MLKKHTILASALLISITPLFANYKMQQQEKPVVEKNLYSGGFVMGLGLTTLQTAPFFGGNAGAIPQFGYYGKRWMFDIGASYSGQSKFHSTFLTGHLGLRNRLYQNLFISYGVMALGSFASNFNKQWSVGAFTGLDYQLSRHFLLSGKVYPYNYDHRLGRLNNSVFANSTISLLYVF